MLFPAVVISWVQLYVTEGCFSTPDRFPPRQAAAPNVVVIGSRIATALPLAPLTEPLLRGALNCRGLGPARGLSTKAGARGARSPPPSPPEEAPGAKPPRGARPPLRHLTAQGRSTSRPLRRRAFVLIKVAPSRIKALACQSPTVYHLRVCLPRVSRALRPWLSTSQ